MFFKQTAETNPCRDVASAAVAIEVWRSADANSAEGLGRLGGKHGSQFTEHCMTTQLDRGTVFSLAWPQIKNIRRP